MAIYHLNMTLVSRKDGRSSVGAAAYRSGERLRDQRTGRVYDYGARGDIETGGLCGWTASRALLWDCAEQAEKHPRAIVAREVVLALPHELSPSGRQEIVQRFAQFLHDRHGIGVDWNIHAPPERSPLNNHAHLLLTTRRTSSDGLALKEKSRELDQKNTGGAHLRIWRLTWAAMVNDALQMEGVSTRVDHRSHRAKGTLHQPLEHLGPVATALEDAGVRTDKGLRNARRRQLNERAALLSVESKAIRRAIKSLVREASYQIKGATLNLFSPEIDQPASR